MYYRCMTDQKELEKLFRQHYRQMYRLATILLHDDADNYVNFDKSQFEPYLTLYHDKLINYYPGHPIHDQIASAETAYRLQPEKPYID